MKAAIYARVSTDAQSENSIPDQIRECQNYIQKEGWKVYAVYSDEAISGADVSREDYRRLRSDALLGLFEYIVVDDLSRIGRDMPEFANLYQELTDIGVNLIGVADGIDTSKPSSKIPVYFKGIMNELYLDDMKAKVIRGLKGQLLRGYSTGGRIYGYKTEPVYDPSGARDKFGRRRRFGCKIIVDIEQADVIKRIFELRKSGLGYRSIAYTLNEDGVLAPRADIPSGSKEWSPGTIRSILLNKKYIGIWEYNKIRWIKKRVKGRRKSIKNSPMETVKLESENLRIVSNELFYSVNSTIQRRCRANPSGKKKYLLSGLLKCENCGGTLIVQKARNYSCFICGNARNKGSLVCDNRHRLHRQRIEKAFIEKLREVILNPQIIYAMQELLKERINKVLSQKSPDEKSLLRQKKRIKNQIDNLLTLVEDGNITESVKSRIYLNERELARINNELEKGKIKPSDSAKITADWIKSKLQNLSQMLDDRIEKLPLVRNELRILFPEKLSVIADKVNKGIEFRIKGKANPFNFFRDENVQLCMASPRGFEPLLPP